MIGRGLLVEIMDESGKLIAIIGDEVREEPTKHGLGSVLGVVLCSCRYDTAVQQHRSLERRLVLLVGCYCSVVNRYSKLLIAALLSLRFSSCWICVHLSISTLGIGRVSLRMCTSSSTSSSRFQRVAASLLVLLAMLCSIARFTGLCLRQQFSESSWSLLTPNVLLCTGRKQSPAQIHSGRSGESFDNEDMNPAPLHRRGISHAS